MSTDPFLGEIKIAGFNFAPVGYAFCNGQTLPIAQNTALFSLLGTTYGGNGQTTFALPNLQSRVPIHFGQGPGLSSYALGQQAGTENVTLTTGQMPAHNHPLTGTVAVQANNDNTGLVNNPTSKRLGASGNIFSAGTDELVNMAPLASNLAIGSIGGSQPLSILQPYLALNFIIALQGIFPSRN
jgi:microcystin-dependent protein